VERDAPLRVHSLSTELPRVKGLYMKRETASGYLIPVERVERAILEIRGERVMLDTDLRTSMA